jgi:hypothetical protein
MPASAILPFAPSEPLAHRRLGDQERAGDLRRGEATERPQGQRLARLEAERRVAAGEDQPQAVVGDRGRLVHLGLLGGCFVDPHQLGEALGPAVGRLSAADPVDRLAPRRRRQPGAWAGRDAVATPGRERRLERVLHRVFGQGEVADLADQRRQHGAALLAEGGRRGDVGLDAAARAHGASARRAHASAPASEASR